MSSNKNLKLPWPQNLLSDLGDGFTFETFNDDQLKGLYFAINMLREIERKALLLRYEQGKTSKEIASVINCSVGYVSVICSKARRHLRAPIRSRYILYGLQKERDRERKALEEKQRWIETIRNMQSIEEKIAALSHISLYEVGLSKIIIRKLRHLHIYGMSELIETVYSKAQKLSNTKKLSKEELDEIIIITEKYGVVWNGAEESGQGAIYKERHFDIGQEVSNTELCHQFNCKTIGKIRESRDTKDIVIIANYSKNERDKWRGETLFVRGAKIPKYQNVPGAKNNILQRKLRENRNVYLFEAIDKERYLYCGRIELAGDPFMQTRRGRDGIILYKRIFPMRLIPENNLETLQ